MHNTYKSDVFSLGMCMLLAAGFSRQLLCDIREKTDMNIISNIIHNALNSRYSENFINLIINQKTKTYVKSEITTDFIGCTSAFRHVSEHKTGRFHDRPALSPLEGEADRNAGRTNRPFFRWETYASPERKNDN